MLGCGRGEESEKHTPPAVSATMSSRPVRPRCPATICGRARESNAVPKRGHIATKIRGGGESRKTPCEVPGTPSLRVTPRLPGHSEGATPTPFKHKDLRVLL